MKRQTAVGSLFLLVGLVIIGAGLYPAIAKPPQTVSIVLVLIGVGVAVFGALLIPSVGAGEALHVFFVNVAGYIPIPGGRRSGDPPAPPPDKP